MTECLTANSPCLVTGALTLCGGAVVEWSAPRTFEDSGSSPILY